MTTTIEVTARLANIIYTNQYWYDYYYLFLHYEVLTNFGDVKIKYIDFVSEYTMIQHYDAILLATGNLDAEL